jgi:hypothetical protein
MPLTMVAVRLLAKKKKKVELGRIFGILGWSWEILQTGFFMVILVARVVKL